MSYGRRMHRKKSNRINYPPIEKDIILNVDIPVGFIRDSDQPFEVLISIDQSGLFIYNKSELKSADVNLIDDNGQLVTIECSIEVIKKVVSGQLVLNAIYRGFKAADFLNGIMTRDGIGTEQTAFAHEQGLLFDEALGYMCKSCQGEVEENLSVVVNIGKPFIMLPDGTKVEENDIGTLSLQADTPSFDELLDGRSNVMISAPCKIIVTYEMDSIS